MVNRFCNRPQKRELELFLNRRNFVQASVALPFLSLGGEVSAQPATVPFGPSYVLFFFKQMTAYEIET